MTTVSRVLHIARVSAAVAVACTALGAGAQTIVNGGFDAFTGAVPTGWTALDPTGESWNSFEGVPSPQGGSYLGVQSLFGWGDRHNIGGVSQTIDGLTVGATYDISFYSMANHTPTGELDNWNVSFGGGPSQNGTIVSANVPDVWVQDTLAFKATSTSQVLTFAAVFQNAVPGVSPDMLNLDGISMTAAVPEPSEAALVLVGVAGLALWLRRRRS